MSTGDAEVRLWAGSTLDERSAERRRQLVDVAFDLLANEGAGAVSVRAVTRAAGLSPRYFYESFGSREELLVAAFDRGFDVIKAAVQAAMADADEGFEAQARASLEATAACLEGDPRLGRALLRETLADATLRKRAEEALPEFVLSTALATTGTDLLVDAARFQVVVLAISGMQVSLMLAWSEGHLAVSRDELVTRILEILTAVRSTLG